MLWWTQAVGFIILSVVMNIRIRATLTSVFRIAATLILSTTIFGQTRPIVVVNATIVDGTGGPAFRGNVRISHGVIEKIGDFKRSKDDEIVNAVGLVLAPGFIDIHNHSESGLLKEGTAANQVSQGLTTGRTATRPSRYANILQSSTRRSP